jgi:hypothetical protein
MYQPPSPEEPMDAVDARMDALLRDFFQAETPPFLPAAAEESPDDWTAFAPLDAAAAKRKWDLTIPVLLASTAVLLVCGWLALPKFGGNEMAKGPGPIPTTSAFYTPDVVGVSERPSQFRSRSQWRDVEGRRVGMTSAQADSLVDLKYYTTSIGAVEQRTNIEWTTVRVWEPESGEWIQASVPSIRIDVVPLGQ